MPDRRCGDNLSAGYGLSNPADVVRRRDYCLQQCGNCLSDDSNDVPADRNGVPENANGLSDRSNVLSDHGYDLPEFLDVVSVRADSLRVYHLSECKHVLPDTAHDVSRHRRILPERSDDLTDVTDDLSGDHHGVRRNTHTVCRIAIHQLPRSVHIVSDCSDAMSVRTYRVSMRPDDMFGCSDDLPSFANGMPTRSDDVRFHDL